jgi:hypothetical protein
LTARLSAASVVVALAICASAAAAQNSAPAGKTVELGIDAVIATTLGGDKYTTVAIPNADFRVGFYVNNNLSIEPRVAINSVSGGGSTYTAYKGELGVLYHFVPSTRVGAGPYVRPFAGFLGESGDGSQTQLDLGVGVGTKIPFGDRMATRIEANYAHLSSTDYDNSVNQLAFSIGISFFTR